MTLSRIALNLAILAAYAASFGAALSEGQRTNRWWFHVAAIALMLTLNSAFTLWRAVRCLRDERDQLADMYRAAVDRGEVRR